MPKNTPENKKADKKEEKFEELERPAPLQKKENVFENPEEEFIPSTRFIPPATVTENALTVGRAIKFRDVFTLAGTLKSSATVTTVAGNAAETTLNDFQLFPNEFYVGTTFRITAAGVYTTDDATTTWDIRLKNGTTAYHTVTTTAGSVSNAPWHLVWTMIIVSIGPSGAAETYVSAKTNNINKDVGSTSTRGIDTTAYEDFTITAQASGGSAGSGDTIRIRQFIVEAIR